MKTVHQVGARGERIKPILVLILSFLFFAAAGEGAQGDLTGRFHSLPLFTASWPIEHPGVSNGASGSRGDVFYLESPHLMLEVHTTPYYYRLIEKETSQVLLQHSKTVIFIDGNSYFSSNAIRVRSRSKVSSGTGAGTFNGIQIPGVGAAKKPSDRILATVALNGTSRTAQVHFSFPYPKRLRVSIEMKEGTVSNIREEFIDQGERVYGIWEYPFQGGLDNRFTDQDLIGFGIQAGASYCNARAPFYCTSRKYGVYAETQSKGHYRIALGGKTSFDFDSPSLQYHVLYGPSYESILKQYNALAGPPVMPPDWAFGSLWWRDDDHQDFHEGISNAQENVLATAESLRFHEIAASAIWIDRPYGTGVHGWGNMDFDSSFPDPEQLIQDLNGMGYVLLLWITNRCSNLLLDEGTTYGYLFNGITWPAADMRIPGACTWFQEKLDAFLSLGVQGYKIDRGGEGEMPDAVQNENVVRFHDAVSQGIAAWHGEDHLMVARNAFDTSRKTTVVWNGDTSASFSGLEMSVKNSLRCGIINFPFFGSDIGGYGGTPGKELFARWLEFGAYTPLMEVLIGPNRTIWHDYDQELIDIAKEQAALHHDLIPYVRSCMFNAQKTGMPVVSPLIFAYPDDSTLEDKWDEFLYGDWLLVAPVLAAGATSRSVYIPEGKWMDYRNRSSKFTGPINILGLASLDKIPVYVKEGAIIPRGDIIQSNNNWTPSWAPNLRIEFFPARSGMNTFSYYDGSSSKTINSQLNSGTLTIQFDDLGTDGTLEIYCSGYGTVRRNGILLYLGFDFTYNSQSKLLTVPYMGETLLEISGTGSVF